MSALGMMEDHNRLLPATESKSGPVNIAMQSRGVLVLACFLVALGSLLCVGKESLAKQPDPAPKSDPYATSNRPMNSRPADAGPPAPATRPDPAPREPVDRGPSSRPARQRPVERAAPAGRRAPGSRQPAERAGTRTAPPEKSAHAQRPVHEPKPAPEPPGFQKPDPYKPVGPDSLRHHPRPEKVDSGSSSRPVRERPAPKTTPRYPRGSENTGQQEDAGSPDQHGKPMGAPGREKIHPEKKSSVAQPEQTRPLPEHGNTAGPRPDEKPGIGAYKKATPGEEGSTYSRPAHTGTPAVAPDPGPPAMEVKEPLDRQTPARTMADHKIGPDVTSGVEASNLQAGNEGGISGPGSTDLRREGPTRAAGLSSAHLPGPRAVNSFQTVGPVQPTASGEKRSVGGEQARGAWGAPFGSTKLLLDPLWDERGTLIGLTREALRSAPGSTHDLSTGALYGGSLTQRMPPFEVPSPFFGFVSMMGGAAAGSSGNGVAPLLAVIAPCLIALLYRDRYRIFRAFLRPATIPRPALERPG